MEISAACPSYASVLNRFMDFFSDRTKPESITSDDLNQFMVHLKKKHNLDNNSVRHNIVIVAQFLKKQGKPGMTKNIDLPGEVKSLPQEYSDTELNSFFGVCTPEERTLFLTFLLTGFREQEVVNLGWNDINSSLSHCPGYRQARFGIFPKTLGRKRSAGPKATHRVIAGSSTLREKQVCLPLTPRKSRASYAR